LTTIINSPSLNFSVYCVAAMGDAKTRNECSDRLLGIGDFGPITRGERISDV